MSQLVVLLDISRKLRLLEWLLQCSYQWLGSVKSKWNAQYPPLKSAEFTTPPPMARASPNFPMDSNSLAMTANYWQWKWDKKLVQLADVTVNHLDVCNGTWISSLALALSWEMPRLWVLAGLAQWLALAASWDNCQAKQTEPRTTA